MTFLRSGSKQSDEDWKGMNSCGVHVFGSKRDLMNMHARVLYMHACVPLECLIFFWPRRLISKMWRVVWMGGWEMVHVVNLGIKSTSRYLRMKKKRKQKISSTSLERGAAHGNDVDSSLIHVCTSSSLDMPREGGLWMFHFEEECA